MIQTGLLPELDHEKAVKTYKKAVTKGVIKVMSKMGISTVQSYQGAQIFEAVGLSSARHRQVLHRHALEDRRHRHGGARGRGRGAARAPPSTSAPPDYGTLPIGGDWQWRKDGEYHLYNPETIHLLQKSCSDGRLRRLQATTRRSSTTSRAGSAPSAACMKFKSATPVPIDEVEAVDSIVKRFKTGAMSFGSISKEAHEAMAIAMNRLGGKSNTGEGGENPERFMPDANGDSRCSAIKQVASGRFGVTSEYLVNAKEIQIKMAQGAKPGEGGQLPGRKVYPWVAEVPQVHAGRRPHLAPAPPRYLLDRGPLRAHPRP